MKSSILALAFSAANCAFAAEQAQPPGGAIRIIVAFPAGSPPDFIMRWNDAPKTAEAIDPDGWIHTGDLATIDVEGYCSIVGRSKDMVIRGGEKLFPMTITGKVQQFALREQMIAALALEEKVAA